jgi:hypothetical protein
MERFGKLFVIFAVFAAVSALDLNEICRGRLFESLPHPTDPNLFIGCVQGKGTLLGCDEKDEEFDPVLVSCVPGGSRDPNYEAICENVIFGVFPSPINCKEFIICQSSRPQLNSCPDNSIFDPFLRSCVPGNEETCEIYGTTTPTTEPTQKPTESPTTVPPPPPTTTTPRTTTPGSGGGGNIVIAFNCPTSGFGNIPHPDDW